MAKAAEINLLEFCRGVADKGLPAAEAYRQAGYKPTGKKDNAKVLASKYMARPDVQEALDEYTAERYHRIKSLTLKAIDDFLTDDFDKLEPKQKATALKDLSNITGIQAAKKVHVHNTSDNSENIDSLLEWVIEQTSANRAIEGIVREQPEEIAAASEDEAELGEEQALDVQALPETERTS